MQSCAQTALSGEKWVLRHWRQVKLVSKTNPKNHYVKQGASVGKTHFSTQSRLRACVNKSWKMSIYKSRRIFINTVRMALRHRLVRYTPDITQGALIVSATNGFALPQRHCFACHLAIRLSTCLLAFVCVCGGSIRCGASMDATSSCEWSLRTILLSP